MTIPFIVIVSAAAVCVSVGVSVESYARAVGDMQTTASATTSSMFETFIYTLLLS